MLPAFEKAVNEPHARCCDRCSDANQAAWIHVISVRMPFLDPFLLILYDASILNSRGMPTNEH